MNPQGKRVSIITLGCKVNQADSDMMAKKLANIGAYIVEPFEHADIYIINSCTVTSKADRETRYIVKKILKKQKDPFIVITGCYAQLRASELSTIPGVKIIIGNLEKQDIDQIILNYNQDKFFIKVSEIEKASSSFGNFASFPFFRTRYFLKIQDGCDYRCSYCTVPLARGPSRSLKIEEVINRIKKLSNAGVKEIVLVGIHLGQYGKDLDPPLNIISLLKAIESLSIDSRIRLSSIEPNELDDELINLIANSNRICHHLHIPLQSGSKKILKLMKRRYTPTYFFETISRIVQNIPDIAIGCDVMVGFPDETEEDFQQTKDLITSLPIAYLHVFPYSERKDTPAIFYPHPVASNIKKHRAKILRELGQKKRYQFYKRFIGKKMRILVEAKVYNKNKKMKGLTGNYIPVFIDKDKGVENQFVDVILKDIVKGKVLGEII